MKRSPIKIPFTRPLGRLLFCLSLTSMALLWACAGGHEHDDHGHDHEHEHEPNHVHTANEHDAHDEPSEAHSSDEIILPPAKAKAAGVEVSVINPGEFNGAIATSGRILTAAGSEATAVATQSGIVRLAKPWSVGMPVAAGTTLFTISNSGLPEGDLSTRARIEFQRAKDEYDRQQKLMADKLTTSAELESARAAYETARLAYEATGSGKGGAAVVAPKGGYVLSCPVKDGDFVDVGTPLMTITQNRRLQLQADLPQRYAGNLDYITSANFRIGNDSRTYSLRELNGRIVSHGAQTSAGTTFIPVLFEFDNAPGVVAGSFAEVWLLTVPRPGVLAVPKSALTEEQGIYAVYVQVDEEGYERRVVVPGQSDGRNVEILSGLNPGERVVTQGATHVKLASASKAIPGHTHNH